MSDYLKTKNAVLGRTARMLSCQSEGRFTQVTSGQALQSVFFRALLQVGKVIVLDIVSNNCMIVMYFIAQRFLLVFRLF